MSRKREFIGTKFQFWVSGKRRQHVAPKKNFKGRDKANLSYEKVLEMNRNGIKIK